MAHLTTSDGLTHKTLIYIYIHAYIYIYIFNSYVQLPAGSRGYDFAADGFFMQLENHQHVLKNSFPSSLHWKKGFRWPRLGCLPVYPIVKQTSIHCDSWLKYSMIKLPFSMVKTGGSSIFDGWTPHFWCGHGTGATTGGSRGSKTVDWTNQGQTKCCTELSKSTGNEKDICGDGSIRVAYYKYITCV